MMSVLVTSENQTLPKTHQTVGIDLGVSDFAITSDGHKYRSQRLHLKYQKQLHVLEKEWQGVDYVPKLKISHCQNQKLSESTSTSRSYS